MKRIALIVLVIASIFALMSCSSNESTKNTELSSTTTTTTQKQDDSTPEVPVINKMEDLTKLEGIVSVESVTFSSAVEGATAFRVKYKSGELTAMADFILPTDYRVTSKKTPVLFYFPEIGFTIEDLARNYAACGFSVIRIYDRGDDGVEGMRDLAGEDIADAQQLLAICKTLKFFEKSKFFVAGSSEGSISALRMYAEDDEGYLSGCAVIDVISDLKASMDQNSSLATLYAALIGKTYDEAPEEYDKRSAVKFTDKLNKPIIIMGYKDHPTYSQAENLYDLLKGNKDCTFKSFDELSSDFIGSARIELLTWIAKRN